MFFEHKMGIHLSFPRVWTCLWLGMTYLSAFFHAFVNIFWHPNVRYFWTFRQHWIHKPTLCRRNKSHQWTLRPNKASSRCHNRDLACNFPCCRNRWGNDWWGIGYGLTVKRCRWRDWWKETIGIFFKILANLFDSGQNFWVKISENSDIANCARTNW